MVANVRVVRLGLVEYMKALNIQNKFAEIVKKSYVPWDGGALLLVEHPPVYTIGIRTKDYSISDEEKLKQLGADFVKTNRGGLITFHGPGQLVAYPILNLKLFRPSMRWYVDRLEELVIRLCIKYSLPAMRSPHTGVWIGERKICAIGVHGSRFVTTHGLAINCNTDLSWYSHIVPCGIVGKGVTSLSLELNREVETKEVIPRFLECFKEQFECNLVEKTKHSGGCE